MRIDKYLKISRLIKRRTVAHDAAQEERIFLNGKAAKPSAQVKPGDEITLNLHVISQGYLEYIYDVQGNSGSNPFYGSPANVSSNIKPEKRALGYFFTSAITKGTCIVRAEDLK